MAVDLDCSTAGPVQSSWATRAKRARQRQTMRLFLQLILVVASYARQHSYAGTGNMRSNPERGFRHELHGACTGEGTSGLSDDAIKELATYNLTVAQVYCYLPTAPTLDNQTLLSIETAMGRLRQAGVKALWRCAYDRLNPGDFSFSRRPRVCIRA